MDHTRKWVLMPSEEDHKSLSEDDIKLILKLFSRKMINDMGQLLSKEKSRYIQNSSVLDCIMRKQSAKHFNRFLELKATLNEVKVLKAQKRKSNWDLDDD